MFIRINGIEYNIEHIKSYQNLWKRDGKEHVKNGSIIEFTDGERIGCDHHIEMEREELPPTIIPALPGYELIVQCEMEDGNIDFWFEPIIAWKIDSNQITPISDQLSWDEFRYNCAFINRADGTVKTWGSLWPSLDSYKEEVLKKDK